jgi:hypothetical protein
MHCTHAEFAPTGLLRYHPAAQMYTQFARLLRGGETSINRPTNQTNNQP